MAPLSAAGMSRVAALSAGAATPAGAPGEAVTIPTGAGAGAIVRPAAADWPAAIAGAAMAGAATAGAGAGVAWEAPVLPGGDSGAGDLVDVGLEAVQRILGLRGPRAQVRGLPRVDEEQQHEDREADDRGEAGVSTNRGDEVVDGEGVRGHCHA